MKCAETVTKKLNQNHEVSIIACDCCGHEDRYVCSIILVRKIHVLFRYMFHDTSSDVVPVPMDFWECRFTNQSVPTWVWYLLFSFLWIKWCSMYTFWIFNKCGKCILKLYVLEHFPICVNPLVRVKRWNFTFNKEHCLMLF